MTFRLLQTTAPVAATKAPAAAPDQRDLLTKAGDFVTAHDLPGSKIGEALGNSLYGIGSAAKKLITGDKKGASDAITQAANDNSALFEPIIGDTLRSIAIPASLAVTGGAGVASNVAKFAGLGAAQGAGDAMAQGKDAGQVGKDAALSGTLGGLAGGASHVLGAITKHVADSLPTRLLRDLTKQSKVELRAGKDVAPTILADKRVGTMDKLIGDAQSNIESLGSQIHNHLSAGSDAGTAISRDEIFNSVAKSFNSGGAALDKKQVSTIVISLAPQVRGLLAKQSLTLSEANQLRSAVDRTLGDKAFLSAQLPFNKDVLKEFTDTLRNTVKDKGPKELRGLFEQQSKEIRLRDTLNDASIADSRKNFVTWRDIISGGIGGGFGGVPGAIAGVALERALGSAPFLTGTAVGIDQTSKALAPILSKLAPSERLLITSLIARAATGGAKKPSSQSPRILTTPARQ